MKVVKNNSDEDAEKNLLEEVRGEDHSLAHFPGKKEADEVTIFREMAALPAIVSPATGRCPQNYEYTYTPSVVANNESHIISLLKGGLS